ncbi:MAG: ComEA family DNA-binding protein [Eubacterium sp.]|nr:ComEA family DNA-binding protein [Eubacterium sp.]
MWKKYILCIALVSFLIMITGGCSPGFLSDLYPVRDSIPDQKQDEIAEFTTAGNEDIETGTGSDDHWIYVHVCGCVKNPGLYRLKEGSRIDAAIRAAGGFSKEADEKSVNLALPVKDGTQIEVLSASVSEEKNSSRDSRINLNLAQKEDLMTLNGIGENRALAIIAYREEHGGFSSVEELKEVEGIGDGIYQKIKNAIKI